MSKKFIFIKDEVIEYDKIIPWANDYPLGTIYYSPDWTPNWSIVISVRNVKVWAKVALRNVPKQYRGLLLLLKD